MSALEKNVYAVPATDAVVEHEFRISGNIVDRQSLNPKTISDLMLYKQWVARHGTIAKLQLTMWTLK